MKKIIIILILININLQAGLISSTARETGEYLLKKFGIKLVGETTDTLSRKIAQYTAKYGDEALPFLRKSGPVGFEVMEQAGKQCDEVFSICRRMGDKGVWVISNPGRLKTFLKYGEEAAEAMIKHPGIAKKIIKTHGKAGAAALNSLSRGGSQKMAMLAADQSGKKILANPKILSTIRQFGDEAMEFVWKNKGALAVTSVLAAFVADPKPFLSGVTRLPEIIGGEIAKQTNWTLIISLILAFFAVPTAWRFFRTQKQRQKVQS